jgi:outer membrane protein assembly factor BamB
MKFIYLIITAVILSSSTCKKEDPLDPPPSGVIDPSKPSELVLDWRSFLADNQQEAFSNNPILNSQQDILMSSLFNPDGREIFKLFDGKTGKLKWTWDDYLRNEEGFFNERHLVIGDHVILSAHNATYAFNMVTGQTVWKNYIDTMYGSPFIFKDESGYVYKTFSGEKGRYMVYVFRTRYDQLNWELVCSLKDSTESYTSFSSSALTATYNKNGDEVIIFTTYKYIGPGTPNKAEVVCYNITQKKFDWIKDYSTRYTEFAVARIKSNQNRVFTFALKGPSFYLTSFDVNTGELLWENKLQDFGVGMFLYKNSIIVTCNNSTPVRSYYQSTGYMTWEQKFDATILPKLNFDFGGSNLFKNYLFSTHCNNMLILSADNGAVVYFKQGAKDGGCLQNGVAINEMSRTFYVQDRKYVNCFKIPQEVKY